MAVSKVLNSASLSIEVENGTDKAGLTVYKKKNFSGVKIEAAPSNVFDVAESIKGVLSNGTRDSWLICTLKKWNKINENKKSYFKYFLLKVTHVLEYKF